MIADANEISRNVELRTDVCIVGAGPAGITLARELVSSQLHVTLLESGGLDYDTKIQSLNEGKSLGSPYSVSGTRPRVFGGASSHWGGAIVPLDQSDFIEKPWLPLSGWPFGIEHLYPYYKRAEKVLKVEGGVRYSHLGILQEEDISFLGGNVRPLPGATNPLRFGKEYREELDKAPNVSCFLHANLLDIETNESVTEVERLVVKALDGERFYVKARQYVLATGGLENARILLLANKNHREGLGNDHGHVGRYFQEHIGFYQAARVVLDGEELAKGVERKIRFSFTKKYLEEKRVMNGTMILLPSKHGPELSSFEKLYSRFRRWMSDKEPQPMSLRYWAELGVRPFDLTVDAEQAPNPKSRVTLDDDIDFLGQQKLALNWDISEFDRNNVKRYLELLGIELGRQNIGRLWIRPRILSEWPFSKISYGAHHCGTTRMSSNPRDGVVNPDCRLHDVGNLYVAGSSVFPTNGRANPTFTIVALAIRLADKIKDKLA